MTDPSVSPADTIRRALDDADLSSGDYRVLTAALAALLAVGERDKAEIERLAGIEAAARTLMDAEDADEDAVDRLISEDDTDGSLSEAQALTRANADAASDALRAVLAGGKSAGERGRRQIARLTEALERIDALRDHKGQIGLASALEIARAVLADEEDAAP